MKNTGQTKTISGFDTRQVVATITVREKGKKIEESGGIVMTVDTWLSKTAPSTKELMDFDRRYLNSYGPIRQSTRIDVYGHRDVPRSQGIFRALWREDLGGPPPTTTRMAP